MPLADGYPLPDRQIRLLHLITGLDIGGAERQLPHILRRLDAARYQLIVCSLTTDGPIGAELRQQGVEVVALGARKCTDLGVLVRLARLLRRRRVDILHAHLFHSNVVARLIGRVCRVPVIVTSEHETGVWKRLPQLLIERATARLGDRVIAVSQAAGDWAVRKQGVPRDRLCVIRAGVSVPAQTTDRESLRHRLREEFGFPQDAPVVLSVGRIHPAKGYEYLLAAVPIVRASVPEARFLIVGGARDKDGAYLKALISSAERLELGPAVTFAGAREDIADLMRGADMLALSSIWEGLPNVLLEAMAVGLPVVSTVAGGCAELSDGGKNMRLVPIKDVRALAAAIIELLGDPALRTSLAAAAQEFAERQLSWDTTAAALDSLYTSMLAARGRL